MHDAVVGAKNDFLSKHFNLGASTTAVASLGKQKWNEKHGHLF